MITSFKEQLEQSVSKLNDFIAENVELKKATKTGFYEVSI